MEVLPRNEEVASTAVPVEVSYNNDSEPEHLFKAVIEGISKAEFTKEVEISSRTKNSTMKLLKEKTTRLISKLINKCSPQSRRLSGYIHICKPSMISTTHQRRFFSTSSTFKRC
jgi:hypothetical protein